MRGGWAGEHYSESDLEREFPRNQYVLAKIGKEYVAALESDPEGEIARAGSPGELAAILRARQRAAAR